MRASRRIAASAPESAVERRDMIQFRDRTARGRTRTGWLDSRHTFSFGGYHDPAQMGFRTLRVINEDRVIPGAGFPTHGHRDMEIVTYVLEGKLQHKDSLGNGSLIAPGEIQRMSAGTGIMHSEYNASAAEPVHFLQIWILPARTGTPPGYEQKTVGDSAQAGALVRAPITLQQDAVIYIAKLDAGAKVSHALAKGRGAWLQVARGIVALNDTEMKEGDGAAIEGEPKLDIEAMTAAEVLVFDLA
jgi:redox-sensitive bicupin YhaK (pirin superfamily)